jgi:hypothetical protein
MTSTQSYIKKEESPPKTTKFNYLYGIISIINSMANEKKTERIVYSHFEKSTDIIHIEEQVFYRYFVPIRTFAKSLLEKFRLKLW